jgi:hypothetical protein
VFSSKSISFSGSKFTCVIHLVSDETGILPAGAFCHLNSNAMLTLMLRLCDKM